MHTDADVELSESAEGVPNAAWTWFTDERAIVDTDAGDGAPRLLVGGVTAEAGDGGGDVVVLWYDVGSGATGHAVLHAGFEQDDHDGPALFVRPDGRYLAMYAKHGTDSFTRWRVSSVPHDPTEWGEERRLDNGGGTTYCNVYRLPGEAGGDGRTYCFTRAVNWDPNVLVSTDAGTTWSRSGRLFTLGDESTRPYLKYWGDGERIHCVTTEGHPHDENNGIYHAYLRDGTLYDSGGAVLNEDVSEETSDLPRVPDLTTVLAPDTVVDGERLTNAWTIDVAVDADAHPVALFQARVDGDPEDHRFLYARHDGDSWSVHPLAEAGGHLYDREYDYTGLGSIDPDATDRVVVSTSIDPRDGERLDRYQLFAGETDDGGTSWDWRALTPDASRDNLRPIVPVWPGDRTALVWMRGRYAEWTEWETRAVARLDY
jgi:hypothetical protein